MKRRRSPAVATAPEVLHGWRGRSGDWQVMLCSFGGQARIDVRRYWEYEGELKATKSGFVLSLDDIDDFIDALKTGRDRLLHLADLIETGDHC